MSETSTAKKNLFDLVYEAIETLGTCTKAEIKDCVYELALERGLLTKEFVLQFGDCGWVAQNLKPAVICNQVSSRKWIWSVA